MRAESAAITARALTGRRPSHAEAMSLAIEDDVPALMA